MTDSELKDEDADTPIPGPLIDTIHVPMNLPAIIFGGAALSTLYNGEGHLSSDLPLRTVRLALRYGIRAFDTAPYYDTSEIVLGKILQSLLDEFPRTSYQLITKCGRYGLSNFDYSRSTVRRSVMQSLDRLKTDYLDAVFLHDVEFVCTPVETGVHTTEFGNVTGKGDQQILDAFKELQALQREGLVKNIGISGYPLPTLLRLAILILHTPPYKPVDIILSYSHLCLQNSTLMDFIPRFYDRAKVGQLISASPLCMGLLGHNPPSWHPAPHGLRQAVIDANKTWTGDFPNLAVGYSMYQARFCVAERPLPLVMGLSTPKEVHEAVGVWREIQTGHDAEKRRKDEEHVRMVIKDAGYLDWSWSSGLGSINFLTE